MNSRNHSHNAAPAEYQVPQDVVPDWTESTKFFPHGRILRALGELLQQDRYCEFELQIRDGTYAVRGQALAPAVGRKSLMQKILSLGKGRKSTKPHVVPEKRYSMSDLLTFESQAREQRKQTSEMPDPYSLGQILRGVGCYLDKREGSRLVGVTVKERWVTIEYLTTNGQTQKEHQDFEYFYDYWVKMYMQRSSRPKLPLSSDPTLFVTWQSDLRRHTLARNSS